MIFQASVATLALAAPEADPALVYAGGLGLGYAGLPVAGLPLAAAHAVPHVPVVKSVEETPAEVATAVTAHAVPVAVGYHGLGYYGKRSADADPAILAGSTRVISAPTPLIHNPPVRPVIAAPAVVAAGYAGLPYAGYAGYAGLPYAAHVIAKRDADADPAILAGSTRVISAPTPLIHNPPVRTVVAAPALGYAGLPYAAHVGYAGLPYAAHVIAKRDAEADPQLIAGLPYAGLPVAGLPLAAAHAVPHVPVVKSVVDTPAEVATEVTAHADPVAVGYHGFGFYG